MNGANGAWKWIAGMLASALVSGAAGVWAVRTDAYTKAEVNEKLEPLATTVTAVRDDVRDLIARLEERGVVARRVR